MVTTHSPPEAAIPASGGVLAEVAAQSHTGRTHLGRGELTDHRVGVVGTAVVDEHDLGDAVGPAGRYIRLRDGGADLGRRPPSVRSPW